MMGTEANVEMVNRALNGLGMDKTFLMKDVDKGK